MAVAPGQARPGFEMFAAGSINGMDPPEHTRLRKLVASAFTARRAEALRPRVASIVNGLIDAMLEQAPARGPGGRLLAAATGSGDLRDARRARRRHRAVPCLVQHRPQNWQRDPDEIMTALAELYGYFGALIEIKRAQPADDLISALIAARDDTDGAKSPGKATVLRLRAHARLSISDVRADGDDPGVPKPCRTSQSIGRGAPSRRPLIATPEAVKLWTRITPFRLARLPPSHRCNLDETLTGRTSSVGGSDGPMHDGNHPRGRDGSAG